MTVDALVTIDYSDEVKEAAEQFLIGRFHADPPSIGSGEYVNESLLEAAMHVLAGVSLPQPDSTQTNRIFLAETGQRDIAEANANAEATITHDDTLVVSFTIATRPS